MRNFHMEAIASGMFVCSPFPWTSCFPGRGVEFKVREKRAWGRPIWVTMNVKKHQIWWRVNGLVKGQSSTGPVWSLFSSLFLLRFRGRVESWDWFLCGWGWAAGWGVAAGCWPLRPRRLNWAGYWPLLSVFLPFDHQMATPPLNRTRVTSFLTYIKLLLILRTHSCPEEFGEGLGHLDYYRVVCPINIYWELTVCPALGYVLQGSGGWRYRDEEPTRLLLRGS